LYFYICDSALNFIIPSKFAKIFHKQFPPPPRSCLRSYILTHKLSSSILFLHFHLCHFILCSYTCLHSVLPLCFGIVLPFLSFGHDSFHCFLSCLSISTMHPRCPLILIFLFTFGSEPSNLLNHLVKFVSRGDLP